MSREPHGPFRRLSMLIVAVPCLLIGLWLCYHHLPEVLDHYDGRDRYGHHEPRSRRRDRLSIPAAVGIGFTVVGAGFVITALTPYRPRSQEEQDAEGECPYTWRDRRQLRQWGDD